MFIAIVVPPCRRSKAVAVTALTAVGLACLFRYMPGLRLIPSGWALILAAVAAGRAAFCDPILSEYYQSLKGRGKHYLTAVGALARKLCNIIFTILRENSPYEATPPKKGGEHMETLILNGSPKRNGNTVALIGAFTKHLNGDVRVVSSHFDNISPCLDCRYCWDNPGCIINDDMQSVYPYLESCDNLVIASPIWFSELSGPLLTLASRIQTYLAARLI